MSLSFHSEHLAWQQRVAQEVYRTKVFYSTLGSSSSRSYSTGRSKGRSVLYGEGSNNSEWKMPPIGGKQEGGNYKNSPYTIGYSFGGTTPIRNAFKPDADRTFGQKAYQVVSRPSTSGSYVGYSRRASVGDSPISQNPVDTPKKQRLSTRSRKFRHDRHPVLKEIERPHKPIDQDMLKAIEDQESVAVEDVKDGSENEEQENPVDDDENIEERPYTGTSSVRTTASQQEYISQLKQMLLAERRRRIEAESHIKNLQSSD